MNKMTVEYPRPLKLERTDCYVAVATGNRFRAVDAITTRLTTGVPEPMINLQSVHDSEVGAMVPLTRFIREFVDEETWKEMNKEPEPKKPQEIFVEKATGTKWVVTDVLPLLSRVAMETPDGKMGVTVSYSQFMNDFTAASDTKVPDASLEQSTEGVEEPCFVTSVLPNKGTEALWGVDGSPSPYHTPTAERIEPSKPSLYELCEYARTLQIYPFTGTNERLTNVYNTIEKRLGLK